MSDAYLVAHATQYSKCKPFEIRILRGHRVLSAAAGARHAVLKSNVGLFAWGFGMGGALGHGNTRIRVLPFELKPELFSWPEVCEVACGAESSFAFVFKPPRSFVPNGTFPFPPSAVHSADPALDVTAQIRWLKQPRPTWRLQQQQPTNVAESHSRAGF